MQYAVMLYFDEDTQKKVNEYVNMLSELTNNEYMLENKMPAHITLAMFNSEEDYSDKIKNFSKAQKSFRVNLSSIGFFNDRERHIFLSPIKDNNLVKVHSKLYDVINLPDEEDYINIYKDNNIWVPHVTIGYQVKEESFDIALGKCLDIALPIKARAIKIAIAVCCPFKEIAVFSLK